MIEKSPAMICSLEVFQFLNEVQGFSDNFGFFDFLQAIVNIN